MITMNRNHRATLKQMQRRAEAFFISEPSEGVKVDAARGEIYLIDRIGGYFGIGVAEFLDAVKEVEDERGDDPATVIINSPGGDVFDGITIANIVRERDINIHISGLAASIASVIAVSGASVTMEDNATMMLHAPWGYVIGNAKEMRREAEVLDELHESLIATYMRREGVNETDLRKMLDNETWLSAKSAVKHKLVDEISKETKSDRVYDLEGMGYSGVTKSYRSRFQKAQRNVDVMREQNTLLMRVSNRKGSL